MMLRFMPIGLLWSISGPAAMSPAEILSFDVIRAGVTNGHISFLASRPLEGRNLEKLERTPQSFSGATLRS